MSELQSSLYRIISTSAGAPTGADAAEVGQVIHLNGKFDKYNVTKYPEPGHPRVYHFTIEDIAVGVDDINFPTKVILAGQGPRDVYWFVNPQDGGYTIAWDHDHDKLWTVADPSDPNSEISLEGPGLGDRQVFTFQAVN